MVTTDDLINIMTDRERSLLSNDGQTTPNAAVLQSSIDRAYEYVLSFVRIVRSGITKTDLPPIFDDVVLQLAKYNLFFRNNILTEQLIEIKRDIDEFLRRVARGEISVFPDEKTEDIYAATGSIDRSSLDFDKYTLF